MFHPGFGLIAGGILLLASIPYVARIRHPEQKPFAAYLIFVSIFAVASVVLFGMLTVVAGTLGLTERLAQPVPAYGGWPFLRGLVRELGTRRPGMMTLVAVAITTAYVYSAAVVLGLGGETFFWELATLIDIMLLGHWIEMRSVGAPRARSRSSRGSCRPRRTGVRDDGGHGGRAGRASCRRATACWSSPASGWRPTASSRTATRRSTSRCSPASPMPVEKGAGDEVVGGAINGEGALVVRVEKTGADSYLSQVVDLVRQAQESKSRTSRTSPTAPRSC
jgi:P-type Cu2+ transporter